MIMGAHIHQLLSRISAIGIVLALFGSDLSAQCTNNNTLIAGPAITPTCPGNTNVPCVQGGQYALVNVVAGNIYTFATCAATFDTQITLFNNAGGASLGYNDDFCGLQSQVAWTSTYTGQLRVLVDLYNCANNAVCAPLTINCVAAPPPAPNDNPCTATAIPVNTSCVYTTSTTVNATPTTGPPAPTCANYGGSDVWFTAVVPASGSLIIETNTGVITDGGMALYTAPSCAGPFVQEACDDDGGTGLMPMINQTGLAPGSTVYIRFWEYGGDNNGTFSICVRTPPPPPAGDCVYVLNLFDSFGDGWGTSNVGVSINGGPYTYYTVGGTTNQVLLGINIGDVIVLNYNNSGAFQFENSYTLGLSGGGVFFNSGSPPAGGISFTQTANCQPPPAAPQDCAGGTTICGSQAFNNNSSNTGNVVDLNTANQGCLSSGERQGTWYYFSPSASGTIGFTISPAAPTDYDFAVWGPLNTVACPPAGPPLRCSYAAPTGDTGAGNGAVDLSEGAGGDRWVAPMNVIAGQIYIMYVDNFSSNGQAFTLSWQLSNGASLDCTVLPIGEVTVDAKAVGRGAEVQWTTTFERGSSHFVIERSLDGFAFSAVGTHDASGRTDAPTSYSFMDREAFAGLNYYRIQSVGTDGTIQYSPVTSVVLTHGNDFVVAPNPVSDGASLLLKVPLAGKITVRTLDASGRLVHEQFAALEESDQRLDLRWPVLDAGAYILLVLDSSGDPIARVPFTRQ